LFKVDFANTIAIYDIRHSDNDYPFILPSALKLQSFKCRFSGRRFNPWLEY